MVLTKNNKNVLFGRKYRAVCEEIKKSILAGRYQAGEKIPSEVDLANQFKVSRVTARQALSLLEKERYISRKQGAGTFVNTLRDDGVPATKLQHLLFILIDESTKVDYYLWEFYAAQRWLAEKSISMTLTPFATEDMIRGITPPLLTNGTVQGVFMDGYVQDVHPLFMERIGIPYLVVGNHALRREVPQIRYGVEAMAARAVEHLRQLRPGNLILVLLEPFQLAITREIYSGYSRAVKGPFQATPILQTCENNDGYEGLKSCLSGGLSKFSIITTNKILPGILRLYRERGISSQTNPIVTFGAPMTVAPEDRKETHIFAITGEHSVLEAVKVFTQNYCTHYKDTYVQLEVPLEPPVDNSKD